MKLKQIIFFILIIGILILAYLSSKSYFITNTRNLKRTNFLILGTDFVDNAVHSDTVLVASYSSRYRVFDIISIPRDSFIDFEETRFKKLTEVYAYLYKTTGKDKKVAAEKLAKILEEKVFVSEEGTLEIPYYVVVDYQGFKDLIDTIGKIKIYVSEPMHYDDNAGNLHIHFDPGEYFMDGYDALKFVRYRDSKGDIGRIARQHQFISSFVKNFIDLRTFIKFPWIISKIKKSIHTNINFWELLNMIIELRKIKVTGFRFTYSQGRPKGRYWEIDKEYILNLTRYLFADEEQIKKVYKRIKIFNASNITKLALKVTKYLRFKGYDVLDWGNWSYVLPRSKIIDYSGDQNFVSNLSNMLNIEDVTTYYKCNEYLSEGADLIIILGNDFNIDL